MNWKSVRDAAECLLGTLDKLGLTDDFTVPTNVLVESLCEIYNIEDK